MPRRTSFEPLPAKGRRARWMVNVPSKFSQSGRRERRFFETKDSAKTFCELLKTKIENYGTNARLLSPIQAEQALQAFEKLAPYKISLNLVVEDWIARRKQAEVSIPFERLLEDFAVSGRGNRLRSVGYRRSIQQVKKRLVSLHGRMTSEITPADIEQAVKGMTPSVRNYTLRILSCAFNLALTRGFASENPLRKVEKTHLPSQEIGLYTPDQVATIMRTVEQHDPVLIPFFAISFFAGVRRSEILRMDWSHIELTEKFIRLPKDLTKTRQGRHIPLESNLLEWLLPYAQSSGSIVPFSHEVLRKRERRLRSMHGIPAIKHGARHCFGTYWLAMNENINRLMLSMGHTDFETTQEHYAKAATRKDAETYWKIEPSAAGEKIIAFAAT
jgi:integrase/recombinase XerD